jgi:hypothetical protein
MKITLEIQEEIKKLYVSGLGIVKISKQIHTSPKKVKEALLCCGIDIKAEDRMFGPKKVKPIGYWDIKKNCEIAAKECRNRGEFYKKYSTAAKNSNKNGWMDEFSEKYFTREPLYASLNDKVHCVYSYEFNETKSVYVGRTVDIKRRDYAHRVDKKDTVFNYSQDENIEIPEIKILVNGLDAYESLNEEEWWVIEYQRLGWTILNKSKTGVNSGSLGSSQKKWTYETCKSAAMLCKNKEEFKKKYSRAHNVSRENGWIDEFFPFNSKKENGYFDNIENCKKEAEKFVSIMDIRKNYPFLYHKISKNKWIEEVREHIKEDLKRIHSERKFCLFLNKKNNLPEKKFNSCEVDFYRSVESVFGDEIVIDDSSVPNMRLIARSDKYNGVFILLTTKRCGSISQSLNNGYNKVVYDYCVSHGYKMILVYDVEYNANKKLVIEKLRYSFKKKDNIEKINARQCKVVEILKADAEEFLNKNHIQGFSKSSVYLGAYKDNKLCGVMTFKLNPMNSDEEWELNRFATDINVSCRGLGSKMLNYFIKTKKPINIVSFADKRFSNPKNNLYEKIGFKLHSETQASYKYFNKVDDNDTFLYHKMFFNKKKLNKKYGFPLTMTETEMAKELGYDRIWDCGLIKYVWTAE